MKRITFVFALLTSALMVQPLLAQEEEVSEEELKQYAIVMDSIDVMKAQMQKDYNKIIKEEELMQGGKRFVELKKAHGNEDKLAEIEATEEEVEAYEAILAKYDELVDTFKQTYPELIKEELGAATYNKVKKALAKDKELKEKYEAIVAEINAEREEKEEEEA